MQNHLLSLKKELKLRNYSDRTVKSYLRSVREYLLYNNDFINFDASKIKDFLLYKKEKGYASKTIHLYLQSIKFFYYNILFFTGNIDISYPKKPKKLPVVLSRVEIKSIISSIDNRKHRLMISLAYGSGLRVSELIYLRVKDVFLEELVLHIWIMYLRVKEEVF